MNKVLLVDDDKMVRVAFMKLLEGEGYEVSAADCGLEAIDRMTKEAFDIVLLDIEMPGMNGFKVCEEIRKKDRRLPVVFLTNSDSDADQVRALGFGADDYITKDTGYSVLIARVNRAIERATCSSNSKPNHSDKRPVVLGQVIVDFGTMSVCEGEEKRHLTHTEAGLLKIFLATRMKTFSISELVTALRGDGFACTDNLVYANISRLRAKLGSASKMLITVNGAGYRFL